MLQFGLKSCLLTVVLFAGCMSALTTPCLATNMATKLLLVSVVSTATLIAIKQYPKTGFPLFFAVFSIAIALLDPYEQLAPIEFQSFLYRQFNGTEMKSVEHVRHFRSITRNLSPLFLASGLASVVMVIDAFRSRGASPDQNRSRDSED